MLISSFPNFLVFSLSLSFLSLCFYSISGNISQIYLLSFPLSILFISGAPFLFSDYFFIIATSIGVMFPLTSLR